MVKIRLIFLSAIFLLTPIVYAWLYLPFIQGTLADIMHFLFPQLRWSGFESVKVFVFSIFIIGAGVSFFTEYLMQKKQTISQTFLVSVLLFFVWSVSSYFLNKGLNPYFFTGNQEKTHGFIFYVGLFSLFWLVRGLTEKQQKYLFNISFIGFAGIVLYAFFQRFGFDPLTNAYNSRLDPWRLFSTLGNPNYLAGQVLLFLPLLRVFRFEGELSWEEHFWEIAVWVISGLIIYWTGSYLAWMVFAGYVGYVILDHLIPKTKYRAWSWGAIVFLLFVIVGYVWLNYQDTILEAQKMKGFIARWYLWKTGFAALTHDAGHFLFGYGPDGFLAVSERFRHPLLSVYEDPAYRIDRSHNVFLDFALHFGVPVFFTVIWCVVRSFRHLSHEKKIALGLFALYFSFNIPVLVHFLIVVQILASAKNKS